MPLLILLEKLNRWLLIAGLLMLAFGYWNRDALPDPQALGRAIDQEPRQRKTQRGVFSARVGEHRYTIKPLFDYELRGMVVSMHHADQYGGIYHYDDWQDYLNIKDICVIWGENVRNGVYRDMQFENTTWTCWASWPNREVRARFRNEQLSNNHLLADRASVQEAILSARPGDQIRLRGVLAEYRNPANGFQRGSSTSRTDRGNGACETVYVDDFQITRRANPGWRRLFSVGTWLVPLSGLAFIALLAITPVRKRWRP